MRAAFGSRLSVTVRSVTTIAAMPIGRLTKKIDCQLTCSTSTPPTSGPTATDAPVVAPQTPSAVPRSRPRKAEASSASEVANMAAPPMPCSARARLSANGDVDSPHSSEASGEQAEAERRTPAAGRSGRPASRP